MKPACTLPAIMPKVNCPQIYTALKEYGFPIKMNSEKMSTIQGSTFKAYCNCFHMHASCAQPMMYMYYMYMHGGLIFLWVENFVTGGQLQNLAPHKNFPLYGILCFAHAHHGYIHTYSLSS